MKEYELLFIVSPRVPADDVPAAIDRVAALITSSGGEVLSADNWGRRRLAYPIRHYFEGTYVLFALHMEPAAAAPLEASLIISEEVIRHLLTEGITPPTSRDRGPAAPEDRDRAPSESPAAAPAAAPAAVAVAEPPAASPSEEPALAVASEAPAPEAVSEPAASETPATEAAESAPAEAQAPEAEPAASDPAPAASE
ncbi:MAG: 30S ribosomal protein S6 [Dehalococcoidia bacterium]